MNIVVTEVEWDTDEEDCGLPSNFQIEVDVPESATRDEIDELISDAITDEYGFCHNGFSYYCDEDLFALRVNEIEAMVS